MELNDISNENCQINRYGYFRATITIVGKAKDQWGGMLRFARSPIHFADTRRVELKEQGHLSCPRSHSFCVPLIHPPASCFLVETHPPGSPQVKSLGLDPM